MIGVILGLLTIILTSYSLTALARLYALRKNILDIPNERSSHSVVTPRGGGLAIAVTFIVALIVMFILGIVSVNITVALVGGGLLIAAIGWADDRKGVSPPLRLVVHFLAAIWALCWMGGFTRMDIGLTTVYLGWAGTIIAVVGIVWLINLYNFMDGIDGIAGSEAVSVALFAGFLLFWSASQGLGWICMMLALAVSGFLVWNWPPARIFMGDVGSGFLGYVFAVLALVSDKSFSVPLIIWLMLLGVFVVDATGTLFRRKLRGEQLSLPHRSHVYQLAIQVGYSHKQVTLAVLFINIVLGFVALVAIQYRELLFWIVLGSFILLIMIHYLLTYKLGVRLNAGYEVESSEPGKNIIIGLEEAAGTLENK